MMNLVEVPNHILDQVKGKVLFKESMKKHTSWKIGGPADVMVIPACVDDIILVLNLAKEYKIPLTILGNGSNVLVKDKGIRGIVLKIGSGFNQIQIHKAGIEAEAGALMPLVAKKAVEAGYSGLEFAAGIPATVGGAVCMNAGAHGKSIEEVIQEVTVLNTEGCIQKLTNEEAGFHYRKSIIRDKGYIVLKALFSLEAGASELIRSKTEENLAKRRRSQPLEYPNAGSVFANPPGQWAGWLIENVDGKGMKVGNAMISEKHANFIVNLGGATAEDVLNLISRIKQLVYEKFHIELNLEIRVIGE